MAKANVEAPEELTPKQIEKRNLEVSQKRAQDKKAKAVNDSASRVKALYAEALAASKATPAVIVPHQDRDGRIVSAILLSVDDGPKKNADGRVVMNSKTGEADFEAVATVWIFSKIDVPHQGVWNKPDNKEDSNDSET